MRNITEILIKKLLRNFLGSQGPIFLMSEGSMIVMFLIQKVCESFLVSLVREFLMLLEFSENSLKMQDMHVKIIF